MEFDKRIPIYQQVQDYVKQQIVSGYYQPGQELQSRREIAKALQINPNTVQRAFKELEEEALIITEPNVPSKVTQDLDRIQAVREQLLEEAISTFYQLVAPLQVDQTHLMEQLKAHFDEQGGGQND